MQGLSFDHQCLIQPVENTNICVVSLKEVVEGAYCHLTLEKMDKHVVNTDIQRGIEEKMTKSEKIKIKRRELFSPCKLKLGQRSGFAISFSGLLVKI